MDAQSEQIIKDLEHQRERLSENMAELQTKVRDVTNWRTYYSRNPWVMIGAALTGGLLISAMFAGSRRN